MRLRPGLRVLRRDRAEIQVGTDPRWAVRLGDLTTGESDLLAGLEQNPDLDSLPTRASAHGVPVARAAALVVALRDARLTCVATPRSATPVRACAAADVVAWSLLDDDGDGAARVRARAARTVGVVGLGRLGLTVATHLAAAGVGRVLLDDDSPVTSLDIGAAGYRMGDVGSPRTVTAARVLRDIAPEVQTASAPDASPDVIVLVERDAASPATGLALMTAGITHLSLVLREADALVGPFVVPGAGVCLRCVDLHRADADPCWPVVAAQLAQLAPRPVALTGEPGVLVGLCGALAAAEVLTHLDGGSPVTRDASYEVALPQTAPRLRRWAVHPMCGCTALDR